MPQNTYFHVGCYYGSVPNTGSNNDVPFVNDAVLTRQNNHAILPQDGRLLLVAGIGANMDRVRLNTPKARYVGLPSMTPVNVGATVPSPPNVYDATDGPISIPRADEIAMESTNVGAGAENHAILVVFGFGQRMIPEGQRYRIRGTAAITASAGTWQNGSIVLDTVLPAGMYALVGLDVVGTNLFAARLVFPGASFRPGCLCRNSAGVIPATQFRSGPLGVYGEFDSVNVPNLDVLSLGANTSQVVYMDVIRISG